ncbi:hypothetical protein VTL71DRAFT_3610 [Oculimacula yallundae]|uniref:PhoD-like phosphatase metallophosphatase domain-containing protein n=1 Tax=Oculimacula yallundae TaxID=86028 RepID=A0ABR4C7N0_9HELO
MHRYEMLLLQAVNAVCISSSLYIKVIVVYFLRWLPLGPRFIPRINTGIFIYLTSFGLLTQVSLFPRKRPVVTFTTRLRQILLGSYTPNSLTTNILAILINALFFLASLDFVHRGEVLHQSPSLSFSRIGFVDESSARITIRSPEAPFVQITYRSINTTKWETGPVIHAPENDDHVATFSLENLQADTTYTYITNASHTGTFQTPSQHPEQWSMLSSSCMSPFFPYNPLSHALHLPGLEHLSSYISPLPPPQKPQFMLFLGDFIYIDLPIRFGTSIAHYFSAYRKIYASPSWTESLKSLPWIHAYDDHEITNDYAGNENDGNSNSRTKSEDENSKDIDMYNSALPPWTAYQADANPPPYNSSPNTNYYTFTRGSVAFFVLDTRRFRSPPDHPDGPLKSILGPTQLAAVLSWLETETKLKVLVSSVPFTRNWRGPESSDSWAGYLFERQILLESMWKTEGVVIISGDRHEHATTRFPCPAPCRTNSTVIEFSTSPLSQFYQPFERQYRQIEDTDIMIHSHAHGVSKFGVFNFNTRDEKFWRVGFGLVVDGVMAWEYEWTAQRNL